MMITNNNIYYEVIYIGRILRTKQLRSKDNQQHVFFVDADYLNRVGAVNVTGF